MVDVKRQLSKSRHILLREIKALGGDATDLDLLQNVLSGSEAEEETREEVRFGTSL
jgi:hypothetical protein